MILAYCCLFVYDTYDMPMKVEFYLLSATTMPIYISENTINAIISTRILSICVIARFALRPTLAVCSCLFLDIFLL